MLADLIQKLAHDIASQWAGESMRYSAAEQMGRDLARQNPELAEELLKTAAKLPALKLPPMSTKTKAVLGATGTVALGGLDAYGDYQTAKSVSDNMKRRKAIRERKQALQKRRAAAPPSIEAKVAAELRKLALSVPAKIGLTATGLAAGAGTIYTGKKVKDYAAQRHKAIQTQPYQHGMAGQASFRQARQM